MRPEEGGVYECRQSAVLRPQPRREGDQKQTGASPALPKDMFSGLLSVYVAHTAGPPAQRTYEVGFQFVTAEQAGFIQA